MTNTANTAAAANTANHTGATIANPPVITLPYDPAEHGAAGKYGSKAAEMACAANLFCLTGVGMDYANTGLGKSGKVTVDALFCLAAKAAGATQTKPVSGRAIYDVIANPEFAAKFGATRAIKYAKGGKVPCPAWINGYVRGHARKGLYSAK